MINGMLLVVSARYAKAPTIIAQPNHWNHIGVIDNIKLSMVVCHWASVFFADKSTFIFYSILEQRSLAKRYIFMRPIKLVIML